MLAQLIYMSRPFGFDAPTLNGILVEARQRNRQHDITGALICRNDIYLQLLEGPQTALEAVYIRIASDRRHTDVEQLLFTETNRRLFPQWTMLDDPARSWLWSPQEVADGALRTVPTAALVAVFDRVSRESIRVKAGPTLRKSMRSLGLVAFRKDRKLRPC